jgi:hypothetical protein
MSTDDLEFMAIQSVVKSLNDLEPEARNRVMAYVLSRFEILPPERSSAKTARIVQDFSGTDDKEHVDSFSSLAELHDAAQPSTNAEKALVAGYWLQVCEGGETFDSQSANTALKNLGDGLANVTAAIDSLKNQKPALALQLRKSGRSQQARKTYKITTAGIKAVENMISTRSS